MQQILQQLQQGTQEVVKDNGDGTLEVRINPPSALQMRAARIIVQIINERDQVVNANTQLNKQLQEYLQENENLKLKVKELNDTLDSIHVSKTQSKEPSQVPEGLDNGGKTETTGSETN